MVNLKISKLVNSDAMKAEIRSSGKLSNLNGRCTGDTTGECLIAIGKAMRDGQAKIGAQTGKELSQKIRMCKFLIEVKLNLQYLEIVKRDGLTATIAYDIYKPECEIFENISK